MDNWEQHVLPHSNLTELVPGLWQVAGRLPRGNMPRNMVLHKLPKTGGLLIHSGIALDDQRVKQMESLGRPEILIVPNRLHRLDAGVYKQRYPQIRVLCPAAARKHVEKKIQVDETCEDALPGLGITIHNPDGIKPGELCYELPVDDGRALVVTDLLFNLQHQPGFDGFLFKLLGSTGFFGITGIGRLFMLQNKDSLRGWLLKMAGLPKLRAVCVGHGEAVTGDVAGKLRAAAERLK